MENSTFNSTEYIRNQDFFKYVENILTCTFCRGFLINPKECIECRTYYCSECLKGWEVNKGGNPLCPMKCKGSIFINSHRGIIQMLEQLIINCLRCSKYVNYIDLINHIKFTCGKIKSFMY